MSKAKVTTKKASTTKSKSSKAAASNVSISNATRLADYYDVIRRPVLTEKSSALTAGKYVFKVHPDSNKDLVVRAVEAIFGVNVIKVNIINVKGKTKNFRRTVGKRSDYKKALITLKEGQSIDIGLEV